MRVTRGKFVRKYLKFYEIVYGVSAPYDVLLDGNFIYHAMKYKIDLLDRFKSLLQGNVAKFHVLLSVTKELNDIGEKGKHVLEYIRRYCNVIQDDESERGTTTTGEQMVKLLDKCHQEYCRNPLSKSNKHYLVATQDKKLRKKIAHIPGIPLIYLNQVTLILEPPSTASKEYNNNVEVSKLNTSEIENSLITSITNKSDKSVKIIDSTAKVPGSDRYIVKKKAKSANPLASIKASTDSKRSQRKKIDCFTRK